MFLAQPPRLAQLDNGASWLESTLLGGGDLVLIGYVYLTLILNEELTVDLVFLIRRAEFALAESIGPIFGRRLMLAWLSPSPGFCLHFLAELRVMLWLRHEQGKLGLMVKGLLHFINYCGGNVRSELRSSDPLLLSNYKRLFFLLLRHTMRDRDKFLLGCL